MTCLNSPSRRPDNYKPAGVWTEPAVSVLVPDCADVPAPPASAQLPVNPGCVCRWILSAWGGGQPEESDLQKGRGGLATRGPRPRGRELWVERGWSDSDSLEDSELGGGEEVEG